MNLELSNEQISFVFLFYLKFFNYILWYFFLQWAFQLSDKCYELMTTTWHYKLVYEMNVIETGENYSG